MKHYFSLLLLFLIIGVGKSQSSTPFQLVESTKKTTDLTKVDFLNNSSRNNQNIPAEIQEYQLFSIDKNSIQNLLRSTTKAISFEVPVEGRNPFQLELVEVELPLFLVKTAPSMEVVKYRGGKHYRGIVKGDAKSVAALSLFDDQVMLLVSETRSNGNWVLGKLDDHEDHIFYNDPQIQDKFNLGCATEDSFTPYEKEEISDPNSRALTDCVGLYFEVDYDIYQDKGSNTTGVTNYVTGIYNQVATLYNAESINTNISEIVIWDQPSPYNGSTSLDMLNQFTAQHSGFNGDLAMLLSYQSSGGIAYVNGLCSSNPDYSMSFSSISSTYQNVPTYSWTIMVITHEFGHLLGSQHTHACVWNGNNTAIDGCYTTEGGCPDPGIPAGGGTVMSYCHLTGAGINLNNGFGPQPGNVIRNSVTNASCLQQCGNPPPPPTCNDNEATLNIMLDNYPGETTWTIKDGSGATLYSGGPYSTANSLVSFTICEPDGCFDFTINDSYGDGICCSYGQGYYEIVFNGNTLISGGQFSNTETKQFCLNSGSTPTCNDGIQNGDETGVDCGGASCPPCATCNDGIQNGDETGVDCGGASCPPCATCNDGIQNGDETGVDCGGASCPPCATCNDGIQNGDETGVDCGGASCPPCATCNDGIQNGDETGVDCGGASCPPCATCNDGIQNGDETGVDCGGASCPPCATCNDGIQNGDETGVDCGGATCPPCATCNDGIQNGDETGVDCGGATCPPCGSGCTDNLITVTINTDNYPGETTWTIKDANGTTILSGGPYSTAGSTFIDTVCAIDGCYDFTINDSYGDGICCSYGQGSYSVTSNGTTYVSGGAFGSSETTNFCLGTPPPPTCDDGVQNGDETGIDCGGATCPPCGSGGTTTLAAHYFENGWDGWIDGGSDCYRYNNSSRAYEGNYSIRLRDNSGNKSAMTSPEYDLSNYSMVDLEFHFYPNSMETGEDFYVKFYDGSTWHTIATYASGTDFVNGTFYVVNLNVSSANYNFASNGKFKIQCDASTNSDQVYIDAVTITATSASGLLESKSTLRELNTAPTNIEDHVVRINPNPSSDYINIDIYDEEETFGRIQSIDIFDMMGKNVISMRNVELNENLRIDVSQITNGAYIMRLNTDGEEVLTQKFQVMRR